MRRSPFTAPSVQTYVSALFVILAVAVIVLFAALPLVKGRFPTADDLVHRSAKSPTTVPGGQGSEQTAEATTEGQMQDLFSRYASTWNEGWPDGRPPEDVFLDSASWTVDTERAKGDDVSQTFDGRKKILGAHLDSCLLLSDESARADATFLLERRIRVRDWYGQDRNPPHGDEEMILDRPVRYAFVLQKEDGQWRVKQQIWLEKGPARLRAADDTTAEPVTLSDSATDFQDLRPTKEQFQERYDSMASLMSSGIYPFSQMYSDYALHLPDDSPPRTLEQAQQHLDKFYAKTKEVTFKATVNGVSQIRPNATEVMVTYRADFKFKYTKGDASYTATWRDLDLWGRSTKGGWYLGRTDRQNQSLITDYYGF